jgi:hypothetical protein
MDIRTARLANSQLKPYSDRIRAHQQTTNKAIDLPEHKTKRATELEVEWDEVNGVYSLGGRRLTFACDLLEFDHETVTKHGQATNHSDSSQPEDFEE